MAEPTTNTPVKASDPGETAASRRKFLEIAGGTALLGGLYGLTWLQKDTFDKPRNLRAPAKATATTPDIVCVEGNPPDLRRHHRARH